MVPFQVTFPGGPVTVPVRAARTTGTYVELEVPLGAPHVGDVLRRCAAGPVTGLVDMSDGAPVAVRVLGPAGPGRAVRDGIGTLRVVVLRGQLRTGVPA